MFIQEIHTLTLTHTSLGMAEMDYENGPVGDIIWHDQGTPEFIGLAVMFGGEALEAEFAVAGSTLTLIMDTNADGEKETIIYTKVE